MSSKRKMGNQLKIFESTQPTLPQFVSTSEEIRKAVEKGAIHRGGLLSRILVSLKFEEVNNTINVIEYEKEEIHERKVELNIDEEALLVIENFDPQLSYLLYFSTPEILIAHPELVMYYRNVAMLSRKVMRGIGLSTDVYEDKGIPPSLDVSLELVRYFNNIIGKLVLAVGVAPLRHLEMALSNIGDGLGGVSRNEVGRYAAAEVMHYLLVYWHSLGYLESVIFSLKSNFALADDDGEDIVVKSKQILTIKEDTNIHEFLETAEYNRVKYHEIVLKNGHHLLLDKQITLKDASGNGYRIGPDMISNTVSVDLVWAGEIKGGADPAGSDEHWKTATQALNRILEAAEKTGRPQPKLSFLATILVDRVAIEAQRWIDDGKLTSVYNLTKISESKTELLRFLNDMTEFMGYSSSLDRIDHGSSFIEEEL